MKMERHANVAGRWEYLVSMLMQTHGGALNRTPFRLGVPDPMVGSGSNSHAKRVVRTTRRYVAYRRICD